MPKPPSYVAFDIETSGLNPKKDNITCIGWLSDETSSQFSETWHNFNTLPELCEETLLTNFFSFLNKTYRYQDDSITLLTYNGKFDLSFIIEKSKKHKLEIPDILLDSYHIDLLHFSKKLVGRLISKDEACRKFANIYIPYKNTGLFLARAYTHKKVTLKIHLDMLLHNSIDLVATRKYFDFLSSYPDFQKTYDSIPKSFSGEPL